MKRLALGDSVADDFKAFRGSLRPSLSLRRGALFEPRTCLCEEPSLSSSSRYEASSEALLEGGSLRALFVRAPYVALARRGVPSSDPFIERPSQRLQGVVVRRWDWRSYIGGNVCWKEHDYLNQ